METEMMEESSNLTLGFYFQAVTGMVKEPRIFFSELPENMAMKTPMAFLVISCLLSTAIGLMTGQPENPYLIGGVYFANAMGMTFIAAGFGYVIMTMIAGRRVTFVKFFSIFAFSSGVTLLVSWLPFFFWITEPWKWWLIGSGMTNGCGFGKRHSIIMVVITICVIVLFFYSVLPLFTASGRLPLGGTTG